MKISRRCPPALPRREELSDNPVKMCHEIAHLARAKMREKNEADDGAMPRGVRIVISHLAIKDGVRQQDIVEATHLRAPTVSAILKELEAKGIVRRERDGGDMRTVRVYLTERGREFDKLCIERIKQVDSAALRGLSEEETALLMRALSKIRDNLLDNDNDKS